MTRCDVCGKEVLNVSWSSLQRWEACSMKAKLYSKHRNSTADVRNFFHGNVTDSAMKKWLLSDEQTPGAMAAMIEVTEKEEEQAVKDKEDGVIKWRHKGDKKELIVFCKELVERLEPILNELVLPYEYQPAMRFNVPLTIPYLDGTPTEIQLIGEIDVLTRHDDGIFSIWDLKATKDNSYWRKTWPQLVFYDIAVAAMFGSHGRETGLLQPMCDERVLKFDITDQHRTELLTRIVKMAHSKWRHEYEPTKDRSKCYKCVTIHACPQWKPTGDLVSRKLSLANMAKLAQESSLGWPH